MSVNYIYCKCAEFCSEGNTPEDSKKLFELLGNWIVEHKNIVIKNIVIENIEEMIGYPELIISVYYVDFDR